MVLISCSDDENPKDHLMLSKAVFFISTKVGEIDWFEMYFMVSMCIYMSYTDLYCYTFLRLMKINLHAILSEAFTPRCQRSRTWLLPEIERLVLTRRVHSLPPSLPPFSVRHSIFLPAPIPPLTYCTSPSPLCCSLMVWFTVGISTTRTQSWRCPAHLWASWLSSACSSCSPVSLMQKIPL